ncbi:MAG: matrixin family metalloprotease [Candidatus Gastranaerophilales bacterium]|nr:matrixin family metalloprotease [Candidatus Gastranaerophilales bacterium]
MFFVSQAAFALSDVNLLNEKVRACNWNTKCHHNLALQYGQHPALLFYYAQALVYDKEYFKGKSVFESILADSRTNQTLKQMTQDELAKLKTLLNDIRSANINDYGNYIDDLPEYYTWKKPDKLKVFIKGQAKREILKQAFHKWDYELYQLVNFEYVDQENNADIVCYCVDSINSTTAGITKYARTTKGDLVKAEIQISLIDPNNNYFNDKEILSVTLHEIGHALGIAGHSKNLNDIMYYSTDSYKNGIISKKDVNTMMKIYSLRN